MKVNVKIRDEWLLIPCKTSKCTVDWLGKEALTRYRNIKGYNNSDTVQEIRRSQGGSLLFPNDPIEDVIEDNDFIYVGE